MKQYSVAFGLLLSVVFLFIAIIDIRPQPCANSISCRESFEPRFDTESVGVFAGLSVGVPPVDLSKDSRVFGVSSSSAERRIVVDLVAQTLSAYDAEELHMKTLISSGKWWPTPTGEFQIWQKVRTTRMTGGEGRDYYDLPNVQFVMFFANEKIAKMRGFAFHSAYWHNNFGNPMSHGCINMRLIDAKKLYEWVGDDPGPVKVTIL